MKMRFINGELKYMEGNEEEFRKIFRYLNEVLKEPKIEKFYYYPQEKKIKIYFPNRKIEEFDYPMNPDIEVRVEII